MKNLKWILVLLGLTLLASAITGASASTRKRRLAACVLEDLATAGLGDVKYSVLSEAQFQRVNGAGWVLMAGQAKTALSIGATEPSAFDYLTTTDNTSLDFLPDGRGIFLRGKNNLRADGAQNPDGEKLIGAYQADELKSHSHTYSSPDYSVWWRGGSSDAGSGAPYGKMSGAAGGNETRSKNITVNTFVKIKRNCIDAVTTNLINTNAANIAALQNYNTVNQCDNCINLSEASLTDLETKLACFKNEVDLYEANQKQWSVTCTARTVGYAKRVLMLIGVNRTANDNLWLSHLDNQYPYYNVVTVQ